MSEAPSGGVASLLHARGRSAWEAATRHPMVVAIGDGTLPHDTFRRYFEQNILYLEDYARAIALVVSRCPDEDGVVILGRFLARIVDEEIPANARFLAKLGGDPDERRGVEAMEETTYAYTRHLLAVAALGDCVEGLTAVLPCQWSYGELARPLLRRPPDDPIYSEWIGMFGDDQYDGLVGTTTGLLDRLAGSVDQRRLGELATIFDRSTRYEVQFWDMAYGGAAP
jgi:thiaminase (transcriptional activator TenA)